MQRRKKIIPRGIVEMYLVRKKNDENISEKITNSFGTPNYNLPEKIKGNFKKIVSDAKEEGLDLLSEIQTRSTNIPAQKTNKENIEPQKLKFLKKLKRDLKFEILKIKKK